MEAHHRLVQQVRSRITFGAEIERPAGRALECPPRRRYCPRPGKPVRNPASQSARTELPPSPMALRTDPGRRAVRFEHRRPSVAHHRGDRARVSRAARRSSPACLEAGLKTDATRCRPLPLSRQRCIGSWHPCRMSSERSSVHPGAAGNRRQPGEYASVPPRTVPHSTEEVFHPTPVFATPVNRRVYVRDWECAPSRTLERDPSRCCHGAWGPGGSVLPFSDSPQSVVTRKRECAFGTGSDRGSLAAGVKGGGFDGHVAAIGNAVPTSWTIAVRSALLTPEQGKG